MAARRWRPRPEHVTWARLHSPVVRGALGLAVVAALVVLACSMAWAQLAGQRLVLNDRTGSPPASRTDVDHVRDHQAPDSTLVRDDPSDSAPDPRAETPRQTSGAGPTTVNGTTAAAVLSLAAVTIGAIVARSLLRRLRAHKQARKASAPTHELEDVVSDVSPEIAPVAEGGLDEPTDHDAEPSIGTADPEPGAPRPPGSSMAATGTPVHAAEATSNAAHQTAGEPAIEATGDTSRDPGRDTEASRPRALNPDPGGSVLYDRRAHLHVPFESQARLQWEGHDLACETVSLDVRGVRCTFPPPPSGSALPVGTPVRITLTVDGVLLPMGARVTSSQSEDGRRRVGLRFDPLDDAHRMLLLSLVDKQDQNG